jgi:hypothetical protein
MASLLARRLQTMGLVQEVHNYVGSVKSFEKEVKISAEENFSAGLGGVGDA